MEIDKTKIYEVVEYKQLTETQISDVISLMSQLAPDINVTSKQISQSIAFPDTHFYAVEDKGHIIACATLCVYNSPTGMKASVEDVVVSTSYRKQHIGKRLMEYILSYATTCLHNVDIHLTSSPHRVEANSLYQSIGFHKRDTNIYLLQIREDHT